VRRFPYDLIAKSGRADLLKRLGKYDDAIDAYDNILSTWPNYETAKNGKAAVLVIKGQYEQAMSLLSAEMPSTRSDWIGRHILGMSYLRRNQLAQAIKIFEEGVEKIPFAREKRYFMNALSIARLRENNFEQAATSLPDTAEGLSNVIRMHAYAGMGKTARARTLYDELRNRCPIQIADLRDAIAGRYGLATDVYAANDNWIFERETEALLQEAA
jgi:tetratricopeptide (TPR) repeat protein